MMAETGQPKLVDFGLAHSMFKTDLTDSAVQSMAGSVIGTPLFMSPEQARGENDRLDGRADIHALGIIMYVMLVRKHLHKVNQHDRWETIRQIAVVQARPPSDFRPGFVCELERIMMKALAEIRNDRYATAGEFGNEIRRFLKGHIRVRHDAKP